MGKLERKKIEIKLKNFGVIVFVLCTSFMPKSLSSTTDSPSLAGELTTPEGIRAEILDKYDTKVPPSLVPGNPTVVRIGMNVNHLSMDEPESIFYVNAWLNLEWNDSRLAWISNGTLLSIFRYGETEIWKPDLTVYNNAYPTETEPYGSTLLVVNEQGKVTWVPPTRIASICKLNMIRWPYDTHICTIKMGSWTHDGHIVDIELMSNSTEHPLQDITFENWIENSEWTLIGYNASRNVVYYECCPEPYVDVTFTFTIQRNSPSYVVCVILPICIIALINMLVFLLPPSSGEKITLSSINLFIICMFLIYFEAKLPSLGDHIPLLVLLYACNLVLVGISLVVSVLVLNLSRTRRPNTPPQCLRLFCNVNFAQILGLGHIVPYVSQTHSRLEDGVEMRSPRGNGRRMLDESAEKDDQNISLMEYEDPYMCNAEWVLLASMIDRISFIVYAVVSGIILGLCLA